MWIRNTLIAYVTHETTNQDQGKAQRICKRAISPGETLPLTLTKKRAAYPLSKKPNTPKLNR